MDVIWLLNFLFDVLLLLFTALLLKVKIRFWRLIVSGMIASVTVFGYISSLSSILLHPLFKVMLSFVIIFAAFGYRRLKFFLQATITFYITTFLMGGGLIGLHYFFQYESKFSQSLLMASIKGFGDPISWIFVILGFPALWFVTTKQSEKWEMSKIRFDQTVKVHIEIQQVTGQLTGLVDSGNQVFDPLSKLPVMFISPEKLEVPQEVKEMSRNPSSYIEGTINVPNGWESRLRMVPCRTVGQVGDLLVAFKPDNITIETQNGQTMDVKGLISFSNHSLSTEGLFDAIVHPKMMTRVPQSTAS
ncbi:sigma-E processing peptidase SpoIIGA [Bacillus carboniphilus]|uniref:Sporulation sigma-E factor-processing peptidase n=1 Tax=Bacillus carboniphilus TaxID=86663 RepID=A0ABP3FZM4_9BACI